MSITLQSLAGGEVIGGGSIVALDRDVKGLPKATLNFWNWWSRLTNTAAGCYIYCTKPAFDAVGGFDEKYFAAEELYFSKSMRKFASANHQKFVIQTAAPVVSSARKLDWFSPQQFAWQVLLLLIPGSTTSRSKMPLWYKRRK